MASVIPFRPTARLPGAPAPFRYREKQVVTVRPLACLLTGDASLDRSGAIEARWYGPGGAPHYRLRVDGVAVVAQEKQLRLPRRDDVAPACRPPGASPEAP